MQIDILNKILLMFFVMCSLNIVRHFYYFTQAWVKSDSDNPEKYKINTISLWILSISIAYIVTSLVQGVFV
jgi:hypothetical protein